ncbi:MAG: hypothetical protein Q9194_003761 [Teloschistes cf. exilis]
MQSTIGAPQQHSQPSRKGKKAWRKNVDVSEVQQGLENARAEVIKGGIVAEKPSESIFTLDTTGSEQIRKTHKTSKPLKADEILATRSAVPAVSTHKRLGVTDGIIEPSSKRRKGNGVKLQEYERLRRLAYGGESVRKDVVEASDVLTHDPWAIRTMETANEDPQLSYLEKPQPVRAPSTLTKPPISLLANASTAVPAVPRPKPGHSYNPVFQDWNALLTSAGEKEVAAERARIAAAAAEAEDQARVTAAQAEREPDDFYKTEEESAWEGFESEYDIDGQGEGGKEWLKKRRPERKTPAERNKVKRRKEAERREKMERETKKRESQARRIKEIAKEVRKEATARSSIVITKADSEASSDDEDTNEQTLRRRKFGKHRLPTPPLELTLPEELRDSLRLLKPEGNLLSDRFRSIMLRGKVETRRPVGQVKKKRRTETEKWTFKDFRVPGEV